MLDSMVGLGTEEDPYQVASLEQLQAVDKELSAHYELVNDINAKETEKWNDGRGFKPIGREGESFDGTFNGNGYEIRNLHINRKTERCVGIFRFNYNTIKNIKITNASVKGKDEVGVLVGYNCKKVSSAHILGDVSGNTCVGGISGHNLGRISSSHMKGKIDGNQRIGGIVGTNNLIVESSHTQGSLSGSEYVGGLIGVNRGKIVSSYSAAETSGGSYIGGLTGRCDSKSTTDCSFNFLDFSRSGQFSDLVISRNNWEISYNMEESILQLKVDNEEYYCPSVSHIEVRKLLEKYREDVSGISKKFKSSVIADC